MKSFVCSLILSLLLLLSIPSIGSATRITSVSVTIGSTTWCDLTGSCTFNSITGQGGKIWDLGTGVDISAIGSTLILTQGQLANAYNFDSSEVFGPNVPVITINGTPFLDTGKVLNNGGTDPDTLTHQEAIDWTNLGISNGLHLWVAYADNAHGGTLVVGPQQCSDIDHNCLPESPWQGSTGITFLGNAVSGGCVPQGGSQIQNGSPCFDTGALRIEQVPEPGILLSLGTSLIAIGFLGKKKFLIARQIKK